MTSSSHYQPAAKRIKTTCASSPADQFVGTLELFDGPKVKIHVGIADFKKTFELPKALLCHNSKFFNAAFNGAFKEATTQELYLAETLIQTFELVIQFLYTGNVRLFSSLKKWDERITCLLEFFITCDKYDIEISDIVLQQFKGTLISIPVDDILHTEQIIKAMELPATHKARKLVIDACLRPYALWVNKGCPVVEEQDVRLHANINKSNEFAATIFQAYTLGSSTSRKQGTNAYNFEGWAWKDPLHGGVFLVRPRSF